MPVREVHYRGKVKGSQEPDFTVNPRSVATFRSTHPRSVDSFPQLLRGHKRRVMQA